MSRRTLVASATIVLAAVSLGATPDGATLNDLEWVLGEWRAESDGALVYESWTAEEDAVLRGVGWRVEDGDTVFGERLRIEEVDGRIDYIADVEHNEDEVPFTLASVIGDVFVFENAEHDWPQRIIYIRKSGDAMVVVVEGTDDGKDRSFELVFTRSN